jgi:hypothetical protein
VGNLDDENQQALVLYLINDSIDTLADAIPLLAGELLATLRPGILREKADALHDSLDIGSGESAQVFGHRSFEDELIACHAPSDP